jgi:hypothetical protein
MQNMIIVCIMLLLQLLFRMTLPIMSAVTNMHPRLLLVLPVLAVPRSPRLRSGM